MPSAAALRFPYSRVLLPRTRLAYIHLRNLLSDAKRDRAARISGYVAIWLPEELVTLYLLGGEVINATVRDGRGRTAISRRRSWSDWCAAAARARRRLPSTRGRICSPRIRFWTRSPSRASRSRNR